MPQREYFGYNSIIKLKDILKKHNPKNIFLVTGKSSYEKSGAKNIIEQTLKTYDYIRFFDFKENPKIADIEKGIKLFKKNNCDFVIAVGGGSVLDIAKSVNILAANHAKPTEYIKNKKNLTKKGKTLVAISTTAGSGSEATRFAVIYINKKKYSLDNELIIPDYAIVDPKFTMNLPKSITASAGMDALSQAIESYWCIYSTEESKSYAKEAIRLVMKNLAIAANNPTKDSRESMAKAAHLAGKAINITKTTACHSISYPITSYFNVPHGHAVALTLASFLDYNYNVTKHDVLDKRGAIHVKQTINEIVKLLGSNNIYEAKVKVTSLMKSVGLKTKLSELGINTDKDIMLIVRNGFNPERVKNNPRKLTVEALNEILNKIR